eukprot:9703821-Ditylum_brightwellii.AAC.1
MDSTNIAPEEVILLNYCQLFLEITTTSEIATSDGKRVREKYSIHIEYQQNQDTNWRKAHGQDRAAQT